MSLGACLSEEMEQVLNLAVVEATSGVSYCDAEEDYLAITPFWLVGLVG